MPISDLRSKLLGAQRFRSKDVEVEVPAADGSTATIKVKIKQPSVEERNAIFSAARIDKDGVATGASLTTGALAIIHCVRDPESDEKIFSMADLDAILHTPAGGWVDRLSTEVMSVIVDAAENAKKSEATPTSNP